MPTRGPHDVSVRKQAVLERVAETGSVRAACRELRVSAVTVRGWAAADVAFGEALKAARTKGDWRRRWAFDEAKATRVLEHLRTGGKMADLPRGTDWPCWRMLSYWRATDGAFGAEVLRLQAVGRDLRTWGKPRGRPPEPFDRDIADRVICEVARGRAVDRLKEVDAKLPSRFVIRRWKREDRDFATGLEIAIRVARVQRDRARSILTPEMKQTIVDYIREGGSLCSLADAPGMPSRASLYAWIARREGFALDVMEACDDREDWWADQIGMAMDAPVGSAKALRQRLAPLNRQWARLQNRPGRKWR